MDLFNKKKIRELSKPIKRKEEIDVEYRKGE